MKLTQFVLLLLGVHYVTSNDAYKLYLRRKLGNREDKEFFNTELREVHNQEDKNKIGSNEADVIYEIENISVTNAKKKNEDVPNRDNTGIGELIDKNKEIARKTKSKGRDKKKRKNDDIISVSQKDVKKKRKERVSGLFKLFNSVTKLLDRGPAKKTEARQIIYDKNTKTMIINRGINNLKPYFVYDHAGKSNKKAKSKKREKKTRKRDSKKDKKKSAGKSNTSDKSNEHEKPKPDKKNDEVQSAEKSNTEDKSDEPENNTQSAEESNTEDERNEQGKRIWQSETDRCNAEFAKIKEGFGFDGFNGCTVYYND